VSISRPRILFVSHSPFFGGAERCLYHLLEGLPRDKYDISVLVPYKPLVHRPHQADLAAHIRRLGIRTRYSSLRWWAGRLPRYRAFAHGLDERVASIADLLRRERIDLVVSNSGVVAEAALAARRCGIPHVWHVLELFSHDPGLRPFVPLGQLYSLMGRLSHRIVAVSHAVGAEFDRYAPSDKLRVIHTGLPEITSRQKDQSKDGMFGLPCHRPVVAFVGLLSERKGVTTLVDSAPAVLKSHPNANFVLAGPDGGRGREVLRKVRQYGIHHAFHILGYRNDVPDILAASDLLALPTLADPLPLAVMEAMRAGIPVVATRSGGCEEMVQNAETGYLVPVNDPASLAEAIITLLDNPSRRVEMGLRGYHRFLSHFNYDQYIRKFQVILDEACAIPKNVPDARELAQLKETVSELQSLAVAHTRLLRSNVGAFQDLGIRLETTMRCLSIM
jgi:glycosyltransferase involved in cell wall biosynthesis